MKSRFRERGAQTMQLVRGQSVARRRLRSGIKNLSEVGNRVPAHGERETSLAGALVVGACDEQRSSVENGRDCGDPRFVVMLRTEIRNPRIRDVALESFQGYPFPIVQELLKFLPRVSPGVTP